MGLTLTEKILRAHSKNSALVAGDFALIKIDKCLANDITAPIAIDVFNTIWDKKRSSIFNKSNIILTPDHFTPNKDVNSAILAQKLRLFALEHNIDNYFEVGRGGIEHCLIPEKGLVVPGEVFIGADSHTCTYGALGAFSTGVGSTDLGIAMASGKCWLKVPETIKFYYSGILQEWVSGKDIILYTISQIGVDGANYKAIEFAGSIIEEFSMANRLTMCNMAIEAGAKNAIIDPDRLTIEYLNKVGVSDYTIYHNDKDAEFNDIFEFNCTELEPQVAFPPLPENTKPISEVDGMRIGIDQVIIGSCTNGRLEDLRIAAKIFRNRKIKPNIRCIIIPGTQKIYLDALKEGLIEIFINAGAILSTPTCGPCIGGHMGILGPNEKAISTTNRNFTGRMGHATSEIYLSNPAIASASALQGYITSPAYIK